MSIYSVFSLLGGLAFFLFGMNAMSGALEKLAGGKLQSGLRKMTSNPIMALIFGAGVTIAMQSSSALTVMLVGFVNSGIMELANTVSIIMGSNIGTTLTAWILSLSGIDGQSFFLQILKPDNLAPIAAIVGILLNMTAKNERKKDTGIVLIGFALLMTGMGIMGDAVAPLAEIPSFASILTAFENPLLGVLTGAVFTAIIQASAASIGILQALALTGSITYQVALPIVMGLNIGTCITAFLSSLSANRDAKRVTIIHTLFNCIGTFVFLVVFFGLDLIIGFDFMDQPISAFEIAVFHSIFNVVTTLILLPLRKQLVKMAYKLLPEKAAEKGPKPVVELDDRLLRSPSMAVSESFNAAAAMCDLGFATAMSAMELMENYSPEGVAKIKENEDMLDSYEDVIGTFLVKLAGEDLTMEDSQTTTMLLHALGDFERLGDHSLNMCQSAEEMHTKKVAFSPEAQQELGVIFAALREIIGYTAEAFKNQDHEINAKIEPLEQVIDGLVIRVKENHIRRLKAGKCTIELGFILNDILHNCERISDHCSNISVFITECNRGAFDTHKYLHTLHRYDGQFKEYFDEFTGKYSI